MSMIVESRDRSEEASRAGGGPSVARMEEVELRAWEDHFEAARDLGIPGLELVRAGRGAALFSPGVEALAMNRTFAIGAAEATTGHATTAGSGPVRALAASLPGAYGARGVGRFFLQLDPGPEGREAPGDGTGRALAELGYRPYNRWVRLHREAGEVPWVLTGLDVVRAEPGHAEAFGRICQRAFELPPSLAPWIGALVGRSGWEAFVALDGGRPVATAAFHVQGEWAWMGWSATEPSHRGRGAQLALVAEMAIQAERAGCRQFTAETAEDRPGRPAPAFRNGLRLGFREVSRRVNWLWEAA